MANLAQTIDWHQRARDLKVQGQAVVYVHCYDADDITVRFGGYKQSGIGRDNSTWIDLS